MIVEARGHDLRCERLGATRVRSGRAPARKLNDDQARNRQVLQRKTRAKPGLHQPCGFFLGVDPHFGSADGRAREIGSLAQIRLDVASGQ